MERFLVIFFCLLLPLSPLLAQSPAVFGTSNPPPAQTPTQVPSDGDLRQKLVGTTWSWERDKVHQKFSFLTDGTVKHDAFVARFVVKSPTKIELQLRDRSATLTFNPPCTRFEGTDFNGKQLIHGQRMDAAATTASAATSADTTATAATSASAPAYFGTTSAAGAMPAVTAPVPPTPPAFTAPTTATPSVSQPISGSAGGTPSPSSQENMKKALELLKLAQAKLQPSSASTAPKAEPLLLVESALDALKQTVGDGRYSGHRVKAMKAVSSAYAELKAGDRTNKAAGYVNEGAAEIYTCVGIGR